MSEFSDKCRAYIEKSNTNVYQISKKSGLDRTMLQKMVKGTKIPSPPFFEKFCDFLVINKVEKQELEELFKIERIGRDVYTRRCEIDKLFSDFKNLKTQTVNKLPDNWLNVEPQLESALCSGRDIRLSTEVDVVDTMRYIIKEECDSQAEPHIYMDIFDSVIFALNQIIRCGMQVDKEVKCTQFVKFGRSNPSHNEVVENIRILRSIFPFAIKFQQPYEVFYSYINGNRHDEVYNIWPHYIVSQTKVLLISENGDEGLLISSSEIAESYIQRLERMKNSCDKLFGFYEHRTDILSNKQKEEMLDLFCKNMEDRGHQKVADNQHLGTSSNLIVRLFASNNIVFCVIQAELPYVIVCIKETELYEAFLDYFQSTMEEDELNLVFA